MLKDYYEEKYVDKMTYDIKKILESNNIPLPVKKKTLRLIK